MAPSVFNYIMDWTSVKKWLGFILDSNEEIFFYSACSRVDRDSSVGIATGYGLGGPRIEYRWGRYFPHLSRPAMEPTQPPV